MADVTAADANSVIPAVLLFNYKCNLITALWYTLNLVERMMLLNVKRTIEAHPNTTVRFYSDAQCRAELLRHERLGELLAASFDHEPDGRLRSDMCRLAMLRSGGYYFDNDLGVRGDMRSLLSNETTLAVTEIDRSPPSSLLAPPGFFQAFVAAVPHHPVIEDALQRHVWWYEAKGRGDRKEMDRVMHGAVKPNVGTVLFRDAFLAWAGQGALNKARKAGIVEHVQKQGTKHVSQLFFEAPEHHPLFQGLARPVGSRRVNMCAYAVVDKRSGTVPLLSRIMYADLICSWGGATDTQHRERSDGDSLSDPEEDVATVHHRLARGYALEWLGCALSLGFLSCTLCYWFGAFGACRRSCKRTCVASTEATDHALFELQDLFGDAYASLRSRMRLTSRGCAREAEVVDESKLRAAHVNVHSRGLRTTHAESQHLPKVQSLPRAPSTRNACEIRAPSSRTLHRSQGEASNHEV